MVVCSFFGRILERCYAFLYIYLILTLLSNTLIVDIFLVKNGIPMILCFISVIWRVCFNGLFKSLFCSILFVVTRKNWIFPYLVKVEPCAVASLLAVFKGISFGCKTLISFQVGMLIISDSAPESILKNISSSGG